MTLRVALTIAGDAAGAKKAVEETKAAVGQLDQTASSAARSATVLTGGLVGSGAAVAPLRLNQQQLASMQFQMNDMATMLASGQSPFVMMMQQGMQIGQIFGPGATVGQALRATGAGIVGFVTNPINLAVAASAVLAGAIPLIWRAFTGPEAVSAEDAIKNFDRMIREVGATSKEAELAAKRFLKEGFSDAEIRVGFAQSAEELGNAYRVELARIGELLPDIATRVEEMLSPDDAGFVQMLSAGEQQIANLYQQLVAGNITAREFRQSVSTIALDGTAEADVRALARELYEASEDARLLAQRMDAIQAADAAMQRLRAAGFETLDMDANLRWRMEPAAFESLADELAKEQEKATREAERAAREQERISREAERAALQRANNVQTIADLEAEVAALGLTGQAREDALAQLREEQAIRQAIAGLGETATQAQISALERLIPLREQSIEQARREDQAAKSFGSTMASVTQRLLQGADAGEVLGDVLMQVGARWLQFAFTGFGSAAAGGPLGPIISAIFGFDEGGWTGPGPKSKPAGIVHADEFVFSKRAVARAGVANLDALHRSLKGYDEGGRVGGGPIPALFGGQAGGVSRIEIALGEGLVGRILKQAVGQAVAIMQSQAPGIASAGAAQAREDFSNGHWSLR